ncbi:hypothetical protein H4Q26_009313 [Puccinia striiformis f. sp. tritici PST-130]|nr:hypothetical protein H4Q26_009313 [Puccinia striiformis f. sp. tritici PST-130]
MRIFWQSPLIFLPVAQNVISVQPGRALGGDLPARTWTLNDISLSALQGPSVGLDRSPPKSDLHALDPGCFARDRPATKLRHNDQFFRVSRLPSSSSVQATEIDFMGILDKPVVSDPLSGKLEQSRVYNGMKSLTPSGTSDKFSEPQLNLELALHPMGTFAKKRKVTSSGPGVVTDIMSGWILPEKSHGNKANIEPHLDLGLALNHPSASDKKRKHPAATPIMEAEVMNEIRAECLKVCCLLCLAIRSSHQRLRATAERSLVPPPPETAFKGPSRIPNRSEQFPKSQEKSQAIENPRKRKNTENRALEKEENHERTNGKRVSEREERVKVLVTPAPKRNSRSKQADPKMRAMFHGSHTDKIWAWIFAGTAYVAEPSDLELKGEMNLKFTTELASKMMKSTNKIVIL